MRHARNADDNTDGMVLPLKEHKTKPQGMQKIKSPQQHQILQQGTLHHFSDKRQVQTCHYCGIMGHFVHDYRKRQRDHNQHQCQHNQLDAAS